MASIRFSLSNWHAVARERAGVRERARIWVFHALPYMSVRCKCLHLSLRMCSVSFLLAVIFQVLWSTRVLPSSSWTALVKLNIYAKTKFTHHSRLFGGFSMGAGTFSPHTPTSLLLCCPGHVGVTVTSPISRRAKGRCSFWRIR